jgi:hypothetical protein
MIRGWYQGVGTNILNEQFSIRRSFAKIQNAHLAREVSGLAADPKPRPIRGQKVMRSGALAFSQAGMKPAQLASTATRQRSSSNSSDPANARASEISSSIRRFLGRAKWRRADRSKRSWPNSSPLASLTS